jgi:hypothetical protein
MNTGKRPHFKKAVFWADVKKLFVLQEKRGVFLRMGNGIGFSNIEGFSVVRAPTARIIPASGTAREERRTKIK